MTSRFTSIAQPQIASTAVFAGASIDGTYAPDDRCFMRPVDGRYEMPSVPARSGTGAAEHDGAGQAGAGGVERRVQLGDAIGRHDHVAVDEKHMGRAIRERFADADVHPARKPEILPV